MRVQAGVATLIFTVLVVAFFCTGDKNTQHAAILALCLSWVCNIRADIDDLKKQIEGGE